MASAECTKCGLSRADAAVRIQRCAEPVCPLRAEQTTNSRQAAAFIAMIVIAILLASAGIALLMRHHKAANGAVQAVSGDGPASAATGTDEKSGGWMSRHAWLWQGKQDAAPAAPAAGPATPVVEPSFDCATARTPSAQFICGDTELAIADRNANLLFLEALSRSRDPRALRRERAAWLAERAKLPPDRAALLASYRDWAAKLGS